MRITQQATTDKYSLFDQQIRMITDFQGRSNLKMTQSPIPSSEFLLEKASRIKLHNFLSSLACSLLYLTG